MVTEYADWELLVYDYVYYDYTWHAGLSQVEVVL